MWSENHYEPPCTNTRAHENLIKIHAGRFHDYEIDNRLRSLFDKRGLAVSKSDQYQVDEIRNGKKFENEHGD